MSFNQGNVVTKLKILVVEDSRYDAELMIRELKNGNFEPEFDRVDSRKAMLKHLEENYYDLVISDFNLPGFSGIEALKLAKEFDSMLPFILISGMITQDEETEILQLGANEVILKNNLNRLPFAIRRVLYEIADKKKLKTLINTKNRLFSVLSHDLKGTLEGIVVLTEFLYEDASRDSENRSLQNSLKLITQSARSSTQLLDNLLNWTLMQQGGLEPSFKTVDLKECLQSCVDIYQSKAIGKNIQIRLNCPEIFIAGDMDLLAITFRNLVSNAIKFSRPKGVVEIEVAESTQSVVVSVRDNGIGIPESIKSKIFDPEDRPKRPGTDQEPSTGLGLLLVKDVMKMHDGSIHYDSEEGKGSTFYVELPKEQDKRRKQNQMMANS